MAGRNGKPSTDPEKRGAIVEQAIRTFAEHGFRATDVQVIADRADVGKGTVYRYFHSKEELFWATTYEVIRRMWQCVLDAMEGADGVHAKLRAAAVAYATFFETNPQYLELTVQERAEFRGTGPESHRELHEQLIGKIGEILQQGIDSGDLRPVDTRHTTIAMGCLLYGTTVLGSHLNAGPITPMAEYAIDIFLQGIRKEPCGRSGTATPLCLNERGST
jgi:AcrR family transcriptional regulator